MIILDKLQRWSSRPASVETKGIAVRLRLGLGQTGGGQLRDLWFSQIFLEVESGDIIDNILAVVDTPGDVVTRVDRDGLNLKNDVIILATLLGCEVPASLELPADDLRILPRHDLDTGVVSTLTITQTQFSLHILTAAVRDCVTSLRFTEEDTVSCRDDDERTRGPRQDGGSAVMALVLSASEGTDPGISPPGVDKHWLGH